MLQWHSSDRPVCIVDCAANRASNRVVYCASNRVAYRASKQVIVSLTMQVVVAGHSTTATLSLGAGIGVLAPQYAALALVFFAFA